MSWHNDTTPSYERALHMDAQNIWQQSLHQLYASGHFGNFGTAYVARKIFKILQKLLDCWLVISKHVAISSLRIESLMFRMFYLGVSLMEVLGCQQLWLL